MKKTTYIWFSIISALIGLASVLLIWIAGSHQYGFLSRIWRYIGIHNLLLISFVFLVLSTFGLVKGYDVGKFSKSTLPLIILALSSIPFLILLFLLFVRFLSGD